MGGTVEGMRNDFLLLDELPQAAQSVAEGLQQLVGGRMVLSQIGQHLRRSAMGIDLGGHFLKLLLVAPQIGIADLEQAIERNIHHLVVQQLLAEILGAQAEIAVGSRQQIVAAESSRYLLRASTTASLLALNSASSFGSFTSRNASGTSCWKNLMVSGNLLQAPLRCTPAADC